MKGDSAQAKTPKLKSCPFCGGSEAYISSNYMGESFVRCPSCGAIVYGSDNIRMSEKQAIEAWNRRVNEQ